MSKEKFVYNKNTLRYEKVQLPLRKRLLRIGAVVSIFAILMVITFNAADSVFESPSERAYKQEAEIMKTEFEAMSKQLTLMSNALENLHARDNGIYREIFEMKPTDDHLWEGGQGGSEKYAELKNLSSGKLMSEVKGEIAKLQHRISLQAKAQDEIIKAAKDKEKMLRAIPSIKPIRKDRINKKLQYLSGFGMRMHPIYKIRKMHYGMDFGARKGTPIHATGDGRVVRVEYKGTGYGKNVIVDHGYGYQTLYAHMSKIEVKPNEKVKKGQIIGRVGSTGTSTSPHLHYEVFYKGKQINPIHFCMDGLSTEEYKEFVEAASQENQALSIF